MKSDSMMNKYRPAGPSGDMDMDQVLAEHCPHPVAVTGNASDVILYDSRIIHWGGANAQRQNRPVVAWTFSLPWYADPYNTGRPRNKQREKFAPLWMDIDL